MPNVTATTAGYLNVTDASATNATTTGNSAVAHIDPQIFLTTSTDNDIVFRGDRGDYILGHLAPLPSVDVLRRHYSGTAVGGKSQAIFGRPYLI